jgi:deazaflavin-dependent oxidoreductase (nitroreductase family)
MKTPPNVLMVKRYRAGLGKLAGRMVLLLTTTGRKTGKLHTVAVQYEKIADIYYIGAGSGQQCDWYRNTLADSRVTLEIGSTRFTACAEAVIGEEKIADFLAYRLKKHPLMVGLILKMDGLGFRPNHDQLLEYAKSIALIVVTPDAPNPAV